MKLSGRLIDEMLAFAAFTTGRAREREAKHLRAQGGAQEPPPDPAVLKSVWSVDGKLEARFYDYDYFDKVMKAMSLLAAQGGVSQPEICICAAVLMGDQYVVRGHRHADALQTAGGIPRYTAQQVRESEQGFVTSRGRFVDRIEAALLQQAAGIASKSDLPYLNGECYSEDLY